MTHHEVKVLPDGRRRYANGHYYTPKPDSERKNRVRKPADPRAVRWRGDWFLPLETLPDASRTMPATRADEEAYDHMNGRQGRSCRCEVCSRGPDIVGRWQRKWRKDHGLRP